MSNRTTADEGTMHGRADIAERRWMSVVFLQGEDADTVLGMIDRNGPKSAIQHLSQWDYEDETRDAALVSGYVYDEVPQSATDRVIRADASGYALTYNHHFGYVSLLRHFDPVAEEPRAAAPRPRFGLDSKRTARRPNGLRT